MKFRYFPKYQARDKEFQVWQKTSHPVELFSGEVIDQKIDYVEYNPVEAGIVTTPKAYLYSSACPEGMLEAIVA